MSIPWKWQQLFESERWAIHIFSVTGRSRSDGSHSLTEVQIDTLLMWVRIPTRDLTDVTLVSEDTDDQDDSDDRDNKMVKKMKRMKKVKKMKTIRRWRRWRINYHYYSDYSQKWARRKFIVFSREWIPYIYIDENITHGIRFLTVLFMFRYVNRLEEQTWIEEI